MPSLSDLRKKTASNPSSVFNGGENLAPAITPENLVQIPAAAPLDLPVPQPQRGVFPPSMVMVSDRSDSTRVFRGPNTRSAVFQNPAQPTATQIAAAISTPAAVAAAVEILVNNQPTASQKIINFINSATVQWQSGANGQISATAPSSGGDGLTHGRTPWESDPSYNLLRDDFTHSLAAGSGSVQTANIGQLGWNLFGTTPAHSGYEGGIPPYLGQFFWDNSSTAVKNAYLVLSQNGTGGNTNGPNFGSALFDNPGWQCTWVFRLGGSVQNISSSISPFANKAMYIGLVGTNASNLSNATQNTARPEVFFGVRYDTSGYYSPGGSYASATAVTQTGNNMAITGTFIGANQIAGTTWVGLWFGVSGSSNTNNNGVFKCTAATTTTLTLTNPNGVTVTTQSITVTGQTPLVLSAAANGNGTQVVYTGAITNGGTNLYVGQEFYVSGFGNAGNNGGPWLCTANSTTSITLKNPVSTGSAETHAGYCGGPILEDTQLILEAVQNPSYTTGAPVNFTQGSTVATGITPTTGAQIWHRLDITCSATGSITITLDGTATLTATVNKQTITTGAGGLNGNVGSAGSPSDQLTLGWTVAGGSVAASPWASGSQIKVTGFSGAQAGFNSTFTVLGNNAIDGASVSVSYPPATTPEVIAQASVTGTVSGYPAIYPMAVFGNDSAVANIQSATAAIWIDFFSFIWNPALGSGETPTSTLPRYF